MTSRYNLGEPNTTVSRAGSTPSSAQIQHVIDLLVQLGVDPVVARSVGSQYAYTIAADPQRGVQSLDSDIVLQGQLTQMVAADPAVRASMAAQVETVPTVAITGQASRKRERFVVSDADRHRGIGDVTHKLPIGDIANALRVSFAAQGMPNAKFLADNITKAIYGTSDYPQALSAQKLAAAQGIIGQFLSDTAANNFADVGKAYRLLLNRWRVARAQEEPRADTGLSGDPFDLGLGDLGGGGGGGFARAAYVPPDRRDVQDMVRGRLAALVGQADPARVESLTDLYMSEDRRAYDSPTAGINPRASITEQIRKGSDYQRIQALRPDSISEEDWIPTYQRYGVAAGLTPETSGQFGIDQATVGTAPTDVAAAAATAGLIRGRTTPEFIRRAGATTTAMLQGI